MAGPVDIELESRHGANVPGEACPSGNLIGIIAPNQNSNYQLAGDLFIGSRYNVRVQNISSRCPATPSIFEVLHVR